MDRRKFIVGSGVVFTSALAGCTSSEDDDEEPEGNGDTETEEETENEDEGNNETTEQETEEETDDTTEEETEEETEDVEEPDPQSFSDSGAVVEDDIEIEGGLTVVDATHTSGEGNFQVHLVPSEGEFDEMFVNEIGEYEGQTAALIEGDTYQLDVEADGDWEIEIRQPRAASGDSLPQSIGDEINQVYGPFEFDNSHTATGEHTGDGNFIVHVYPPEGDFGEMVFNEIGEYEGETTFRHDGVGWVAVEADGEWSLELE